MSRNLLLAAFLIAVYVVPTGAIGQNSVYRCGNSYSQKPCPDAAQVDVQDARTPAQKLQADATTKRDTATANTIEKTRLADEAQQRAAQTRLAAAQSSAQTPKDPAAPADTTGRKETKGKGKRSTRKQPPHAPGDFVAIVPGTGGTKPNKRKGKSASTGQ